MVAKRAAVACQYIDSMELLPGDKYVYCDTVVVILRSSEPYKDRFNHDMIKYWARREDTNAEGWVTFGFGAEPVVRAQH